MAVISIQLPGKRVHCRGIGDRRIGGLVDQRIMKVIRDGAGLQRKGQGVGY